MSVDSAMNISGRGTVVTGTIEQGKTKVGDEVHMIGIKRKPTPTTITVIETFHKLDRPKTRIPAHTRAGILVFGLLNLFFPQFCRDLLRSRRQRKRQAVGSLGPLG